MGRHALERITKSDGVANTDAPSGIRIYLDDDPEHWERPWMVDGFHMDAHGLAITEDVEWYPSLAEALIGAYTWAANYDSLHPSIRHLMTSQPDNYVREYVNGDENQRDAFGKEAERLYPHSWGDNVA